jgi:hypothetical protein
MMRDLANLDPCVHGLWILALVPYFGVDAFYALLGQLLFLAAMKGRAEEVRGGR